MRAIPPIEEQRVIVTHASRMLQVTNRLVESVKKAIERVERSSQAVLAKVFRGELIPVEAGND